MTERQHDRPPNAEVNNTGELPEVVKEFERLNEGEEVEGKAGSSDPSRRFREQPPPSDEELAQHEEQRERRLDPENRPDKAEVDNTEREFDPEKGVFLDKP